MRTGLEFVTEYLQSVPAWYLATCDDDQPHVRPFSFAVHHDARIWFCTSKEKDVYQEMLRNPRVEASAWKPLNGWLVLRGRADLDAEANETIRRAGFAHMKALGEDWSGSDDPNLTFFTLRDAEAWICDIDGSRIPIDLEADIDALAQQAQEAEEAPLPEEGVDEELVEEEAEEDEALDLEDFDDVS